MSGKQRDGARERGRNGGERQLALITGGTRGIGLGIARALARERWNLVLSGLRAPADIAPVIEELRALGSTASYIVADISDAVARAALLEEARAHHGVVNALV